MVRRGRKKNTSIHTKSHKTKLKHVSVKNDAYEDIILHIPVTNIKETKESSMTYDPCVHVPSKQDSSNMVSTFQWIQGETALASSLYQDTKPMEQYSTFPFNSETKTEAALPETKRICSVESFNKQLLQTKTKNDHKKCMWCTCHYTSKHYHLPLQIINKEYRVFGQFCSAECAAAYNFYDIVLFGDMWNRYSLLHSLYYKEYNGGKINIAPSRMALSIYGGNMSIEEFRRFSKAKDIQYVVTFDPVKIHNTNHNIHQWSKLSSSTTNKDIMLKRKKPMQSSFKTSYFTSLQSQ